MKKYYLIILILVLSNNFVCKPVGITKQRKKISFNKRLINKKISKLLKQYHARFRAKDLEKLKIKKVS